jgi:hypothetical protein
MPHRNGSHLITGWIRYFLGDPERDGLPGFVLLFGIQQCVPSRFVRYLNTMNDCLDWRRKTIHLESLWRDHIARHLSHVSPPSVCNGTLCVWSCGISNQSARESIVGERQYFPDGWWRECFACYLQRIFPYPLYYRTFWYELWFTSAFSSVISTIRRGH